MKDRKRWYKRWTAWLGIWTVFIVVVALLGAIVPEQEAVESVAGTQAESDRLAKVAEMDATKAKEQAEINARVAEADAKKATEKALEVSKEKADAKAEQVEIDTAISTFVIAKEAMISESNGVITQVNIEHNGIYLVDIYVDEATWASSSKSEKESFATTIGTAVQSALPDSSLVDFRSATNNDIIASGKAFGGYKIKR